jgi:hypothetical protein
MTPKTNLTLQKIKDAFPGAIPSKTLALNVQTILHKEDGYIDETTLLTTSLCSDEVNRKLESDLTKIYTSNFNEPPRPRAKMVTFHMHPRFLYHYTCINPLQKPSFLR